MLKNTQVDVENKKGNIKGRRFKVDNVYRYFLLRD